MKSYLQDIISHINALGNVDTVKVTGTDQTTTVNAITDDRNVMISGEFKTPSADFVGTFGMPNLTKLKTILSFEDYDAESKISMTKNMRDGVLVPEAIHFETKNGDFVNDYRLMTKEVIEDMVKNVTYKGSGWNVEFEPSVANIIRLKRQASANSEEKVFTTIVKDNELRIHFGDVNTHSGNFVFETNVTGTLANKRQWPVKEVIDILNLAGDKTYRINDQGATEITVDSGLAVYKYLIPAHTK
jgi:hypothetical protein